MSKVATSIAATAWRRWVVGYCEIDLRQPDLSLAETAIWHELKSPVTFRASVELQLGILRRLLTDRARGDTRHGLKWPVAVGTRLRWRWPLDSFHLKPPIRNAAPAEAAFWDSTVSSSATNVRHVEKSVCHAGRLVVA